MLNNTFINKIARFIIGFIGMLLGIGVITLIEGLGLLKLSGLGISSGIVYMIFSLVTGIIFFIFSSKISKKVKKSLQFIENEFQKIPMSDIILGSVGLIIGLVIAYLITIPLSGFFTGYLRGVAQIVAFIILGYLGIRIPTKKRGDIESVISEIGNSRKILKDKAKEKERYNTCPKILDTSVIIDGRIADICQTGFIEGPLVIPEFVLEELQHIADSSDDLKRNRGRRGLDILNKIQKEIDIEIIIHDKKFEDVQEVDSKLLKLTQMLEGKILTNDYNLNKVAEVQKIPVLNINELANAVKPVVLPGEEMLIHVVKDGKEHGQGLAYLDDGTMIVVEGGKKYIGQTIDVLVTSVLQTSAGKMIFGKPKEK